MSTNVQRINMQNTMRPNERNPAKGTDTPKVILKGGCRCEGVRQSWATFLAEVSVNGAKYLAQRETPLVRRSTWLLLVLAGTAFMVYQVASCVLTFSSHPTAVDITMRHNHTMRFPAVTICNENTAIKSIMEELNVLEVARLIRPPWPVPGQTPNFSLYEDEIQKIDDAFDGDWGSFYEYVAPPLADTYNNITGTVIKGSLFECNFAGELCNSSDFIQVRTTTSTCYQFSSEAIPKHTMVAGGTMGLNLVLFVNQREYSAVSSKSAGFRVLVHDPQEPPLMLNHGLLVSPGRTTMVSMEHMEQADLGPPYGACFDEPGYRYKQCLQNCSARYLYERCGCGVAYVSLPNVSVCNATRLYECRIPAEASFYRENMDGSLCQCPRQCHQSKYHLTVSTGTVSHLVMEHLHANVFTNSTLEEVEEYMRDEYALLEIYYADLSYLEVSVVPAYTFMAMLCDIGGALGLILGSSLLTLVEFLDFLVCLRFTSRT